MPLRAKKGLTHTPLAILQNIALSITVGVKDVLYATRMIQGAEGPHFHTGPSAHSKDNRLFIRQLHRGTAKGPTQKWEPSAVTPSAQDGHSNMRDRSLYVHQQGRL